MTNPSKLRTEQEEALNALLNVITSTQDEALSSYYADQRIPLDNVNDSLVVRTYGLPSA